MAFRRRKDAARDGSAPSSQTENLHLSLAQMRTALNSLPMGVIVVDQTGSEWWRNRAAHDLLDSAANAQQLRSSISGMTRGVTHGAVRRSTLEVEGPPSRAVEVRTVPLVNGGGLIVLEDVSERILTDRVRTDFVANISHELKTPIGAMSILAETIMGEVEGTELGATLTPLARRIVDEAQRVSRIINDLLELATIEFEGAAPVTPVRMQSVAAEAVARVKPFADNKGIKVSMIVPENDVEVAGDSVMLTSAVANLVENAVKYSDRGAEVVVSLELDGGNARLSVSDTGLGIAPEHLDRIFERFYRVDAGRSRETGGTGLGLSIVRHIVTNHGGEVQVTSALGEGTSFTILIPVSRR